MTDRLKGAFDVAMRNVYKSALSECGYRATRFLQLIDAHGGLSAAKQLLRAPGHPEGLTRLWELQRLDISMEALVLQFSLYVRCQILTEPWRQNATTAVF